MSSLFYKPKHLAKKLHCSWGNPDYLYMLKKDLSSPENLSLAKAQFPMLKKLVNKYKISPKEVERCRAECNILVFSERKEIKDLKEFFRHWLMFLY